jgi:ferrochelatase
MGNHCLSSECCNKLTEKNAFCYRAQCFQTARKLAEAMQINPDRYSVCFQSRLGKDHWIKPYSDEMIKQLAAEGKKRLLVLAPAFVSDCLETIYEIGVEYDELFKEHGGEKLQMVESLNDSSAWIEALKKFASKEVNNSN